jgi:hypothetical protein
MDLIKEKMERGLENIDKCLVCNEPKVRISKEYFLPANCFIFSIHDLTKTALGKFDAFTNRYLSLGLACPGELLLTCEFWAWYGCEECLSSTQEELIPGHC